jgi:hypothetical protein
MRGRHPEERRDRHGQPGRKAQRPAFAGRPRASVGVGVSVLWGLVRIHVARAVESSA